MAGLPGGSGPSGVPSFVWSPAPGPVDPLPDTTTVLRAPTYAPRIVSYFNYSQQFVDFLVAGGPTGSQGTAAGVGSASAVSEYVGAEVYIRAPTFTPTWQRWHVENLGWTDKLTVQIIPPEGNQKDWPNPRGPQYAIALRTWIGGKTPAAAATGSGDGAAAGIGSAAAVGALAEPICLLEFETSADNLILEDGTGLLQIESCDSSGLASGIGTASGVGAATAASAGAASGLGDAVAVGASTASCQGSTAGTGAATATGVALYARDGSAAGIGAAAAVGASTAAATGLAAGVGDANAVGFTIGVTAADGNAAGFGDANGVGFTIGPTEAIGNAAGIGSANGVAEGEIPVVPSGGGGVGIPHRWTRKRWRELLALIAAEKAARAKAERLEDEPAKQEPLLVAAEAAQAAILAAQIEGENARLDRELIRNANAIRGAIRAANQIKLMKETAVAVAISRAIVKRRAEDDEDEMITLLLLS